MESRTHGVGRSIVDQPSLSIVELSVDAHRIGTEYSQT